MRRLIVALDYGTSNSAAAYTIVQDGDNEWSYSSDHIEIIRHWSRAGGSRDASDKVPSEIAYGQDGQPIAYGFEASGQGATTLRWVKLLLEPGSLKDQSNRTSRVWDSYYKLSSEALQKRPVDVVGDYLRWLWRKVQVTIVDREGEDEDTELFDPQHLTVVLTVPASWSAPAKQRMATAAVLAGIPEQCLKTLAEPEAAAVYGLQKRARKRQIGDGDCVIICDAGGGTVAAVAYRVRTREPLLLDQVTVSKGDFCGSSFVNKAFKIQLRSILGDKYDALSEEAKERIDDEFEFDIKRAYNPQGDGSSQPHYIALPGWDDNDALFIRDGKMRIDEAIVFDAFNSVITQIMTLIDDQIESLRALGLYPQLKGILLVGGFGKSGFLRGRIKEEFPNRSDPQVWAPDDSWTAVVRGAIAFEASTIGHRAVLHSRLSANNYGVPYTIDGARKVHWLIRKGQPVEGGASTEPYGLRIDDQPWLDQDEYCLVYVPIVASEEEDASGEYSDAVAPYAEIKCRVPTALRFAPVSRLIQVEPSRAWRIPAELSLQFEGALISFKCQIQDDEVGAKVIGATEVDYLRAEDNYVIKEDTSVVPGSSSEGAYDSGYFSATSSETSSTRSMDVDSISKSSTFAQRDRVPRLESDGPTRGMNIPWTPRARQVLEQTKQPVRKPFYGLKTRRDMPKKPAKHDKPEKAAKPTRAQALAAMFGKSTRSRQEEAPVKPSQTPSKSPFLAPLIEEPTLSLGSLGDASVNVPAARHVPSGSGGEEGDRDTAPSETSRDVIQDHWGKSAIVSQAAEGRASPAESDGSQSNENEAGAGSRASPEEPDVSRCNEDEMAAGRRTSPQESNRPHGNEDGTPWLEDESLPAAKLASLERTKQEQPVCEGELRSRWKEARNNLHNAMAMFFRHAVPRGRVRITWQCHCGKELFADLPDSDSEAAAALEMELRSPVIVTKRPVSGASGGTSGQTNMPTTPAAAHLAGQQSASAPPASGAAPSSVNNRSAGPAPPVSTSPMATNSTASLRPAFFELCVNTGRYCQRLGEIDVTRVTNDVELFRWIRRRYRDLRDESSRRHRRFWQASAIHFVYFGLEQAGKVHILCNEESFPPDDEVSARRWHLHPSPPKPTGASPMPSNTFIHYLRYCDLDVEVRPAQRTWLDKLPKKLHESMAQQARARGEHVLIEAWACTSSRV